MLELNVATVLFLGIALATLIALFMLVGDSRRLTRTRADMLLWAFLRRRGVRREALVAKVGERGARAAEMRCAACGSRIECVERLAQGTTTPASDCPNGALFPRSS
jgi:hypothetical protein